MNLSSLLKRVYMFLEDGEFEKANEYCENILDESPECAEAYLCKLCAELKVNSVEKLSKCFVNFENNKNYQKVLRFGDENIISTVNSYLAIAKQNVNNEIERKNKEIELRNQLFLEKKKKWIEKRKAIAPLKSQIIRCDEQVHLDSSGQLFMRDRTQTTVYYQLLGGTSNLKGFAFSPGRWLCGLLDDGRVCCTYNGVMYSGINDCRYWNNIIKLSGNSDFCVGLKNNGTVVAAGNLLDKPYIGKLQLWQDIVDIDSDYNSVMGLKSDGTVVYVNTKPGYNNDEVDVSRWKDIVDISCGGHCLGLKSDGTVLSSGRDNFEAGRGLLNVGNWKDIVAIHATLSSSVGLKSDGTVVAAGGNLNGECNVLCWENIVAIAGDSNRTLGVREDGTVVSTGADPKTIYRMPDLKLFDNYLTFEKEKIIARKKLQEDRTIRRQNNVCQYCGGTFKGWLSKTCSNCGAPKDY